MGTLNQQLEGSLALERQQDSRPQFDPTTPMGLIAMAAQRGASVEQMQQLFELKLRVEADEARKAFNAAMAMFKSSPPQINKNKHVRFGNTEYKHATLDHVTEQITSALSKVGISHKWDVQQNGGQISVSCILTHELGHSESTTLSATADTSGSKNAIQAIGSAVTYLQRYTLLAATGMAAAGTDTDGDQSSKGMDQEEFDRYEALIANAPTIESLQQKYLAAAKDAKDAGDKAAAAKFNELKNKRYRELA